VSSTEEPADARPVPRLVGSGRVAGMVQLHQALPLIERQHALIEEMSARAPRFVTAAELARRTGTTARTVERDVARLVAAGVPVQARRGPGGGYRIDARRVLPPLSLTPGEAAALIASLVAVGPYISAAAQTALAKLLGTLAETAGCSPRDGAVGVRRGMMLMPERSKPAAGRQGIKAEEMRSWT
jgi:predicted DNA-binding transcriptional regulator YafY